MSRSLIELTRRWPFGWARRWRALSVIRTSTTRSLREEYFQFFAFFNNSQDADRRDESPRIDLWSDEQEQRKIDLKLEIEELKKKLATPTPELIAAQAEWLQSLQQEPEWTTISPVEAKAHSRKLDVGEDGWIVATGDKSDSEEYNLEFETDGQSVTGIRLEIPQEQKDNFVLSNVGASWSPLEDKGINARYVRVELPGNNRMLHIAELQVFSGDENIALKGKASQSSTDFVGKVEYANDGNTDGNYQKNSVTHTANQNDPWLEIDLGSAQTVDSVVVWNRTDNGAQISGRIKGYKLLLLDDARETVWEQTPEGVPSPSYQASTSGTVRLSFAAAFSDYNQAGFPAESVIASKPDKTKGWAIGGGTGQPHDLTLVFKSPKTFEAGRLRLRLEHSSVHKKHLLDHFRVSITPAPEISRWASLPNAIRSLVKKASELSDEETAQLADYYRSIAPALAGDRDRLTKRQQQLTGMKPYTTVPVHESSGGKPAAKNQNSAARQLPRNG